MGANFDNLKKKMNDLNYKIKDGAETLAIKGLYKKDEIDERLANAKSDVVAAKEKAKKSFNNDKSKFSSELIKLQINMEEGKKKIDLKKDEHDQKTVEKYINDKLAYADNLLDLADLAYKEANESFLEAMDAQIKLDERKEKWESYLKSLLLQVLSLILFY